MTSSAARARGEEAARYMQMTQEAQAKAAPKPKITRDGLIDLLQALSADTKQALQAFDDSMDTVGSVRIAFRCALIAAAYEMAEEENRFRR